MSAEQHVQAVGEIYAAFGRGDIPFILAQLADDVTWDAYGTTRNDGQDAGVPWMQERHGHAGVVEFFEIVGRWEFHSFEVNDLMASDNQVAAEIALDATVPETGRFSEVEVHVWTFGDDGKVAAYRHFNDTAKHMAAAGIAVAAA